LPVLAALILDVELVGLDGDLDLLLDQLGLDGLVLVDDGLDLLDLQLRSLVDDRGGGVSGGSEGQTVAGGQRQTVAGGDRHAIGGGNGQAVGQGVQGLGRGRSHESDHQLKYINRRK